MGKAISTTRCKRGKKILEQIWERKDPNKEAEWINNMETELQILEEGTPLNIHTDELKPTLKKYQTGKNPGLDGIHCGFKNSCPYMTDLLQK